MAGALPSPGIPAVRRSRVVPPKKVGSCWLPSPRVQVGGADPGEPSGEKGAGRGQGDPAGSGPGIPPPPRTGPLPHGTSPARRPRPTRRDPASPSGPWRPGRERGAGPASDRSGRRRTWARAWGGTGGSKGRAPPSPSSSPRSSAGCPHAMRARAREPRSHRGPPPRTHLGHPRGPRHRVSSHRGDSTAARARSRPSSRRAPPPGSPAPRARPGGFSAPPLGQSPGASRGDVVRRADPEAAQFGASRVGGGGRLPRLLLHSLTHHRGGIVCAGTSACC